MSDTKRLIAQCKQIAAIFDETMPDTAISAHAHRVGGVNPYYNRTTSGLYIEFYYGYPSKIWTPGGYWAMTGSTVTYGGVDKADVIAPFMARITTRLYDAERHEPGWGVYGPVYAILAVDSEPVEEPGEVIRFARFTESGYAEIKAEWAELAEVPA